MALNVTTAVIIPGCKRTASKPSLAQWDQGQILKIEGVDLPQAYQVEFCCRGDTITITQIGNKDGVSIPNSLLQRGETIVGYLVLHEGLDDRETEYWIDIYVKARPSPQDVTPSPEEQSVIDELIAALNAGVDAAEEAQAKAEDAQEAAEAAVTHYPKIEDRYWYVWLDGEWVNTGVKAEGVDGRGIVSVDGDKTSTSGLVDTYTMTVTYTDDTTDTITFTVTNGFSPEVTITPVTHGHQVTITDQEHPEGQTFVILDGEVTEAELDDVKNTLNHKADVIYDTASGDIASFPDGADGLPVKDLTVAIEPVQDLHGYENPWPAGGGKNLLNPGDNATQNYVTKTVNADGTITFTGTATTTTDFYFNGTTSSYTSINLPNGEYYIEGSENGSSLTYDFFWIYQKNDTTYYANGRDHTRVVVDGSLPSRIFLRVYSGYEINVTLKLGLSLLPYQANTWSPYSNICPISGRTGCEVSRTGINVWDEEWELGSINSTTGEKTDSTTRIRTKNYINVKPNTRYFINTDFAVAGAYDNSKRYIGQCPWAYTDITGTYYLDMPQNAYYLLIVFTSTYGTTYNNDISINYPSTDTDYHSGTDNTAIPISWETEAGTVYGGSDELVTGALTSSLVEIVYDGSEDEGWVINSNRGYYISLPDSINKDIIPISNYFITMRAGDDSYLTTWSLRINSAGTNLLVKPDISILDTVEKWKTYLSTNNLQIVFGLATPLAYQLTPQQLNTLLGDNNIFADCGDVEVKYPADTKLYIDKKLAALVAALS